MREDKGRGEQQRKMIAKMTVTVRGKGKDRENKRMGKVDMEKNVEYMGMI